jgi:hypothetical protein
VPGGPDWEAVGLSQAPEIENSQFLFEKKNPSSTREAL